MGNCHRHWVKAKSCDAVQAHKSCTTRTHTTAHRCYFHVCVRVRSLFLVRARAPRGSSACDHLAECRAGFFPLRSLLPYLSQLSLSLSLCIIVRRRAWSVSTDEANIERYAKVTGSRFDPRFIELPFETRNTFLSIVHLAPRETRPLRATRFRPGIRNEARRDGSVV